MKLKPFLHRLILLSIICFLSSSSAYSDELDSILYYLKQQDWPRAISTAKQLEHSYPKNSTLYYLKGVAEYNAKNYDASKVSLTKSIALGRKTGDVYYYRGIVNLHLKNPDEAVLDLTTTLTDKSSPRQLTNLAPLLHMKANPQQYLSTIYFFRALAYREISKFENGLEDINRSLELTTHKDYQAYKIKGDILFQLKEFQKAYESYSKSLEFNPSYFSSAYGLAIIDLYYGNYQNAITNFNIVLANNPQDIDSQEGQCLCYLFTDNTNKALEIMQNINTARPTQFSAFYLGYIYYLTGNHEEAASFFSQALNYNLNILAYIKYIYNRLPDNSKTKSFYSNMIHIADSFYNKSNQSSLAISDISITPNPVKKDNDFKIHISITPYIISDKITLNASFFFTISQNKEVLFKSETRSIEIINGESGVWTEDMSGVPVTGEFDITVFAVCNDLDSKASYNFTIE